MFSVNVLIYRCVVQGNSFYYGVLIPTCFVLLTNFIILIFTIRSIVKSRNTKRKSTNGKSGVVGSLKQAKIILVFSVLLGMTWLFAVLTVGLLTEVFQYLFCIFNSLQGFFIFIFFTLTNDDVLKEWKILLGIHKHKNGNLATTTGKARKYLVKIR